MTQIVLPLPQGKQPEVLLSPARFKVLRVGRRGSKTVCADIMCVAGHGPITNGVPKWKGIAQGLDVIWLAPDNTQNEMLWHNTVEKRYRNIHPGVKVDATKRYVSFNALGGGTLWYRSMENLRAARGAGAGLGGVVVEEAAWIDLENALRDVIIPALTDEEGWLALISTTNAGPDGNALKRTPSYFNLICEEITAGKRSADWVHFHWTARDNPAISERAFNDLCAEYPDKTDPKYLQEVEAALLRAGVGLAFADAWDKAVHLTRREPTEDAAAAGGMDWGFEQFGWFGIQYTEPDGQRLLRYELPFQRTRAFDVGKQIGELALRAQDETGIRLTEVVHDASMDNDTDGGPTIVEKVRAGVEAAFAEWNALHAKRPREERKPPMFVPAPRGEHKGKPQRAARKDILHDLLHFTRDKDGVLVQPPQLRVHEACPAFVECITTLPRDPLGKEDVDTSANDHAYDGYTYLELSRVVVGERQAETRQDRADYAKLDSLSKQASDEWTKMEVKWEQQAKRMRRRRSA